MPSAIFAVSALVYVLLLGERSRSPSPDNHFVHLALSFLHGELGVLGNQPPGTNDWAFFEGRWYVSFPPFPAVVIMPLVAIWGTATLDRLFWAVSAGVAPALLYVLLRFLRESGRSERTAREDLLLTTLFAFGTVYFFVAVQGAVWFAAHVVGSSLICLYLLYSFDARRPVIAGALLGMLFLTRTTTLFLAPFFLIEALRVSRREDAPGWSAESLVWHKILIWLRGVQWGEAIRRVSLFALPVAVVGGAAAWMNYARFHDPFEFGHTFLQIRWKARIDRWGLFNYHYLSKNLAIYTSALPWLSGEAPYVRVSQHGLALWFTTPHLLAVLWPKWAQVARAHATMIALYVSVAVVALLNLCYQNSGWIQFGYRFSLDYMVLLFVLLALGRRRFGPMFVVLAVFAIAVNTFGALTFDRAWEYYDRDGTQEVIFQPD